MILSNKQTWIGQKTAGVRVLAYFCEDDLNELNRRQIDINKKLGINNPSDALRNFHMQSRVGKDNLLMTFDKGVGKPTPFYAQIVNDIALTKAEVVILDNAAQLFGGNENDRREVTQFVNLLYRLIEEMDITVVLLGHPAKVEGSEYSGSTAWDACFRSRLYFGRPQETADSKDPNNADIRLLRRSKANYGKVGAEVQVRWYEGAFGVIAGDVSDMEESIAMQNVEKRVQDKFLELLDKLNGQGRNTSHSKQAQNYAPKMMSKIKGNGGYTNRQFAEAMEALLNNDVLVANAKVGTRTNRGNIFGLARVIKNSDIPVPDEDSCT